MRQRRENALPGSGYVVQPTCEAGSAGSVMRNAHRPSEASWRAAWSSGQHGCIAALMGAVRVAAATAPHGTNPVNGDEDAERRHEGEKAHFAAGV